MKLKSKIAVVMTALGVSIILLTSIFYYYWSLYLITEEEQKTIADISLSVSQEIDTHFSEMTNTVKTLSSAPIICDSLLESNTEYATFSEQEREELITSLGQQWSETDDLNTPFLKEYLDNPVSNHLKLQKKVIEGRYGELFITNRYGVIIASTNKLTTINHAHKYWWLASYNDGRGRVFLDDRGFDESADGYVLGIVVPIIHENEIIGIMKSNVNILDILDHVMEGFEELYEGSFIRIVRTGGLIVSELGNQPLSSEVSDRLVDTLNKNENTVFNMEENDLMQLIGVSTVPITIGSESLGFGGSYESIDHILGNTGENWHAVVSVDMKVIMKTIETTTQTLIFIGILFTLITSFVSLYFGKKVSNPLVELSHFSQKVGEGDLSERITIESHDEIGILANSFNDMVDNLQSTMASKDELLAEVEKRKKAEEELKSLTITDELTKINNRRAANHFLHQNIEKYERYDDKLSVILLDIDHFKKVNDNFGHDFGDAVLIILAQILSENIRDCDMAARIGGEEFLIVLPQINKDQAYILAERLRIAISEYDFENIKQLTVSMGISEFKDTDTFDSLLKRADDGLYESKNTGRNKVTLL